MQTFGRVKFPQCKFNNQRERPIYSRGRRLLFENKAAKPAPLTLFSDHEFTLTVGQKFSSHSRCGI